MLAKKLTFYSNATQGRGGGTWKEPPGHHRGAPRVPFGAASHRDLNRGMGWGSLSWDHAGTQWDGDGQGSPTAHRWGCFGVEYGDRLRCPYTAWSRAVPHVPLGLSSWGGTVPDPPGTALTSHMWSWKSRRSFCMSSATSAAAGSAWMTPAKRARSFSFSIFPLWNGMAVGWGHPCSEGCPMWKATVGMGSGKTSAGPLQPPSLSPLEKAGLDWNPPHDKLAPSVPGSTPGTQHLCAEWN